MATWVIGDIHGCFDEFMELLKNENIMPNDKFIIVGDIIDRGPKVMEMLNWAMENITEDGKYQMILGNHEDMVVGEYEFVQKMFKADKIASMRCRYGFQEELINHGYEKLSEIKHIIDWMNSLPLYKKLEVNGQTYIIAHAWCRKDLERTSRDTFLWEREVEDFVYGAIEYEGEDSILIHGHTPTIFLPEYGLPLSVSGRVFENGNGINIDCGLVYEHEDSNLAAIRLEDKKIIYLYDKEIYTPEGEY